MEVRAPSSAVGWLAIIAIILLALMLLYTTSLGGFLLGALLIIGGLYLLYVVAIRVHRRLLGGTGGM